MKRRMEYLGGTTFADHPKPGKFYDVDIEKTSDVESPWKVRVRVKESYGIDYVTESAFEKDWSREWVGDLAEDAAKDEPPAKDPRDIKMKYIGKTCGSFTHGKTYHVRLDLPNGPNGRKLHVYDPDGSNEAADITYRDETGFTRDWKLSDSEQHDPVNRPAHYMSPNGVECIDWIEEALTPEEFVGYLKGCHLKYFWRYKSKGNPKQDLDKMNWYGKKLAEKEG